MTNTFTASAPLALRFGGIAWPLASERVTVTVRPTADARSRLEAASGARLWVAADLPAPVDDEGPLGPVAAALRDLPLPGGGAAALEVVDAAPDRPGVRAALRRATLAALAAARGEPAPPPAGGLEAAIVGGAPADEAGPVQVAEERVAWLSAHLVLFDDPFLPITPPRPRIGDVDPRLLVEAAPAALLAALTGHGAPDRPSWREEHLDRALRAAGLLARFRAATRVGLVLVEPGRRRELEAVLAAHGLAPAPCDLGGPGVTTQDRSA